MPSTLQAPSVPQLEDGFDLNLVIVVTEEDCAVGEDCDTSDSCSSTCPSAVMSASSSTPCRGT